MPAEASLGLCCPVQASDKANKNESTKALDGLLDFMETSIAFG